MRWFFLMLSLALWVGVGCERFPQDPRHTLERALDRGTLRVGVLDQRPWVTGRPPDDPGGLESRLLADFADELGVGIEWHWGSAEEHFEALSRFDLDVVIGGFTASNPWSTHVGFTMPYYTSYTVVGVPASGPMIDDLEGVTVAVRPGSGLRDMLEDRGAEVVVREEFPGIEGPVAAQDWEIDGMGFRTTEIRLRKHPHVMAVPPGENALLMQLEDFLLRRVDTARMKTLLREATDR